VWKAIPVNDRHVSSLDMIGLCVGGGGVGEEADKCFHSNRSLYIVC